MQDLFTCVRLPVSQGNVETFQQRPCGSGRCDAHCSFRHRGGHGWLPILIGPLALPAGTVVALITFSAAVLASIWWQWRGKPVEKWLWLITLAALAGARLAFVLRYPDQYAGLMAMADIRDGGWLWPGSLAALPVFGLCLWRRPALRLALLSSTAAAMVAIARLRLGQYRHFSPAGGTPGGPEVDQGRPLGQRLERNRSALQVLQGDFRQWRCVRGHAVKCGEREPHGDHCRGGAGE